MGAWSWDLVIGARAGVEEETVLGGDKVVSGWARLDVGVRWC